MSSEAATKEGMFLTDREEIRRRARQQIMDGAVTAEYKGDRKTVVRILNQALATELVCVLRYNRHHYMAKGIHSQAVAEGFLSTPRRSKVTPTRSRKESCNGRGAASATI